MTFAWTLLAFFVGVVAGFLIASLFNAGDDGDDEEGYRE